MNKKDFVKDYLQFTHKERLAIISLVVLIIILVILPHVFPRKTAAHILKADTSWMTAAGKVMQKQNDNAQRYDQNNYTNNNPGDDEHAASYKGYYAYEKPNNSYSSKVKGELFRFDPNTLDAAGWQRLGLSSRTAETIIKYRSKGGKFYKPEDLQKIWGIPPGLYERIVGYVDLPATVAPHQNTPVASYTPSTTQPSYSKPEKKPQNIEINSADSLAFATLPGINVRYGGRIVNFRDRLGGFYSIEQLRDVYGMQDSTFQKMKPYLTVNAALIRKININTATKDDLKLQPYIKWQLGNMIVDYRNQHGKFVSLQDLKKVQLVTDELLNKISPYLTL